jgi:hypothetical protein
MSGSTPLEYDYFLSYSHYDQRYVSQLIPLLELKGRRVFWDGNLKLGDEWEKQLEEALKASETIVVLWCCDASKSEYVKQEVSTAIEHQKSLVPIRLCSYPIPPDLQRWQCLNLASIVNHQCDGRPHRSVEQKRELTRDSGPEWLRWWRMRNTFLPPPPPHSIGIALALLAAVVILLAWHSAAIAAIALSGVLLLFELTRGYNIIRGRYYQASEEYYRAAPARDISQIVFNHLERKPADRNG